MESATGISLTVPVNAVPLIDSTDFQTVEDAIAYNASGMDLRWNFRTAAGVQTATPFTPTSGGLHDWTNLGDGIYTVEIPASGGTVNNNAAGVGWITGKISGVLAFAGPEITFTGDSAPVSPLGTAKYFLQPLFHNNPLVIMAEGTVSGELSPTYVASMATNLSRPHTTLYNHAIILPEGDEQVIHFEPPEADEEDSTGFTWEFNISTSEHGNTTVTTIAEGAGLTVLDPVTPTIQVELPSITGIVGYSLVQLTPRRRTAVAGTILIRATPAVG